MEAPANAGRESRLSSLQMPLNARVLLSQDPQSSSVHRFMPAFIARWCTARPAIIPLSGNVRVLKAAPLHAGGVGRPYCLSACTLAQLDVFGRWEILVQVLDTTCWARNSSQQSRLQPSSTEHTFGHRCGPAPKCRPCPIRGRLRTAWRPPLLARAVCPALTVLSEPG
jgi:hypothetical protein